MSVPTINALASSDGDATDRELVLRALEGERTALRQLVERHQPFVYNIALKMFGQREDAQDLTQEVFVKVITSLKTFRHESALRTWLYRVTVNHFLKTRRRAMELGRSRASRPTSIRSPQFPTTYRKRCPRRAPKNFDFDAPRACSCVSIEISA